MAGAPPLPTPPGAKAPCPRQRQGLVETMAKGVLRSLGSQSDPRCDTPDMRFKVMICRVARSPILW